MNTAVRCAAGVLLETYATIYGVSMYYAIISLFFEIAFYAKAFTLDIKSVFNMIDHMKNCENPEMFMLQQFTEAVNLHDRVYR